MYLFALYQGLDKSLEPYLQTLVKLGNKISDRTGQDRTGQDKTRQDKTRQDRTGQDRTGIL